MKAIDCLIVDDDLTTQKLLTHYVGMCEGIALRDTLSDGAEALQYLRNTPIKLLFLDVEMPGLSGIELLRSLPAAPATVLTTSHVDFAIDAFDLKVVDYLVKPIEFARFNKAVGRAREHLTIRPDGIADTDEEIFVKSNNRMVKVRLPEVRYIQALADYVVIFTTDNQHVVYSTMKSIEARLRAPYLMRVHRSYIVNLRHIDAIEDNVALVGKQQVPISKSYQERFYARISKI